MANDIHKGLRRFDDTEHESVSTEQLNNFSLADQDKASWFSQIQPSDGGIFVPPGLYYIDQPIVLGPGDYLWSTGAGTKPDFNKDPPVRGATIRATPEFPSGEPMVKFDNGGNNYGIEYMGLEGIHLDAEQNADYCVHASGARFVWLHNNVFSQSISDTVLAAGRMLSIKNNEFVQQADGGGKWSIRLTSDNSRSTWIKDNQFVSQEGGIRFDDTVRGTFWVESNRFGIQNEAYVSIAANSEDNTFINIKNNRLINPTDPDGTREDRALVRFTDFAGTSHGGPIYITGNTMDGEDFQEDGNIIMDNAIVVPSTYDVPNGLFIKDNHIGQFNNSPAIDLGGMASSPQANIGGNEGSAVAPLVGAKAYLSSSFSISADTDEQIPLDATAFDDVGEFDSANNQFGVKRPGRYRLTGVIRYTNISDGISYQARIKVNGATVERTLNYSGAAGAYPSVRVSTLADLSAGDTVALFGELEGESAGVGTGEELTNLTIERAEA